MSPDISRRIVLLLSFTLLTYAFLMNAWASEDAYISFRTVENFSAGYGLTWNPGDRVQAFTHPLWVLLMSVAHGVTSEVYLTSIVLSYALLVGMLLLLWRRLGDRTLAVCLVLVGSKAFVDYASSGLENVLSYALAAAFFGAVVHGRMGEPTRRNVGVACLLAALAFITRQDTILLYLPALVYRVVTATRALRGRVAVPVLAGLAPAILWELFSLIYYGFPFPNSAYAKLGSGIAAFDLVGQGLRYYANSLAWDPLTLTLTLGGVIWAATRSAWSQRAGALGVVLYLLYVVRIGGDFMSGRFFALPFLVAVILLASVPMRRAGWGVVAGIALVSLLSPAAPLRTTRAYESLGIDAHGIADERGYYFRASGLLFYRGGAEFPDHPGTRTGIELRDAPNPGAIVRMVGYFGFAAGPEKIVVDPFGIADPLLARLPVADPDDWRIGHFERALPAGYVESVLTGENAIENPELRKFHDRIRLIVSGPLFSAERLRAIVAINTGRYDRWVDAYLAAEALPSRP